MEWRPIASLIYSSTPQTTQSAAIMRLLHYPPQSPTKVDEGQIGIGAHTEFVGFTLGSSDGRADIPPLKLRGKDVVIVSQGF